LCKTKCTILTVCELFRLARNPPARSCRQLACGRLSVDDRERAGRHEVRPLASRRWPKRVVVGLLILVLAAGGIAVGVIVTLARNLEHREPGLLIENRTDVPLEIGSVAPDGSVKLVYLVGPNSHLETGLTCPANLVAKARAGAIVARRRGSLDCNLDPWVIEPAATND